MRKFTEYLEMARTPEQFNKSKQNKQKIDQERMVNHGRSLAAQYPIILSSLEKLIDAAMDRGEDNLEVPGKIKHFVMDMFGNQSVYGFEIEDERLMKDLKKKYPGFKFETIFSDEDASYVIEWRTK